MKNKKRIRLFYLLLFFLFNNLLLAQVDTAWTKTFGGDGSNSGIYSEETFDGGFIILSSNRNNGAPRNIFLTKTNSDGQLIWEKNFITDTHDYPRSMVETSDSGFVIFGDKNYTQAWLIKTDKNGDTLWTKTFYPSEEGEMQGQKVIEDNDGGYILLGAVYPEMMPEPELWLAKVDKNGNLEWSQNILWTISNFSDYFALLKNERGFFIAVTDGNPSGNYFIQTDSLGDQIWQNNTSFLNGLSQSFNSITFAVKNYPDSGYVLTGENMGNLMVTNIDSAANVVWAKEYERFTPSINTGNSIINDYDGGFILAGGTSDNDNSNLFLVKTDKYGDKVWAKSYEYSFGKSIGLTSDNGYIVCGTKDQKVWLLKFKIAPIASIMTDSIWIDNEWDGYSTNTLDGSSSTSPNGFTITNYEWNYKGNTVGTNTTLEIDLPTGDNIIELKVTDEKGISNTVEYVVKVCSFKLETNGAITSSISTINDSIFFASSADDQVYCFNRSNQLEWTLSTGGDIRSTTTIGPNKNIYVGSGDTRLYCFDPLGNFKWDTPMGGVVSASPAITQERTVYVGTENNRIYSINGITGNINWNYLTNGAITSSASLSKLGNIYFGSNDKKFYSLNPNGTLNWSFDTNGEIHSSPAIDTLGNVYFGSNDSKLYALNSSGSLNWSFSANGPVISSPVIDAKGNVYFGSGDGYFYAVNKTGTEVWKYNVESPVNGNPSITLNGNIVFGCDDGRIISLTKDGGLNWYYKTGLSVKSAPLITADGRIYISSSDKSIYGFINPNTSHEGFTHQWPTFQKDNKRTGSQLSIATSVEKIDEKGIPKEFALSQNYPNPFNPTTNIEFSLPKRSDVTLKIYDLLGEKIVTLINETKDAGIYEVHFDANNLSSGIYYYTLYTGNFVQSKKMLLIK